MVGAIIVPILQVRRLKLPFTADLQCFPDYYYFLLLTLLLEIASRARMGKGDANGRDKTPRAFLLPLLPTLEVSEAQVSHPQGERAVCESCQAAL